MVAIGNALQFIKQRILSGMRGERIELNAILQPFVYRRY